MAIIGRLKIELKFPIQGLHEGLPAEDQPPMTSPSLRNVRPFDTEEDRIRGGQRPGLVKAYSTQVAGDHPIIGMVAIATTYIEPA